MPRMMCVRCGETAQYLGILSFLTTMGDDCFDGNPHDYERFTPTRPATMDDLEIGLECIVPGTDVGWVTLVKLPRAGQTVMTFKTKSDRNYYASLASVRVRDTDDHV